MSIVNKIPNYMFIYNTIAHLTFAIVNNTLLYGLNYHIFLIVGHLFIALTQFLLYMSSIGFQLLSATLTGCIGHTFLFIYASYTIYKYGKHTSSILFLIGQIGMIYFYLHHNGDNIHEHPIFVTTFLTLIAFYLYEYVISTSYIKYPTLMVAFVYIIFAYHYAKFKLNDPKNRQFLQGDAV